MFRDAVIGKLVPARLNGLVCRSEAHGVFQYGFSDITAPWLLKQVERESLVDLHLLAQNFQALASFIFKTKTC